jgi:AsmA protein
MGKTGKWIVGTVVVLVGLLLLLTLSLPFLIDPNSYKEIIARKVQEQTGRQVSIPGDIALKISPLGLKTVFRLGEVRLSSTPNFPETELLTSRLVEIQLALWPLIRSKELQMSTLRLEGVSLNLVRNEDGASNWSDGTAVAKGKPEAQAQQPGAKPASPLAAIDIGGVVIKDLNLSYVDRQAGKSTKLNDFNLTAGRIQPGNPIPMESNFALLLDSGGKQPLTARINAKASLTFVPDQDKISVQGFSGNAQIAGGGLPVPELGLALTTDLDLDLRQEKVDIKKLNLQKDDMRAEAVLSLTGWAAPRVTGTLRIPSFSPRAQAAAWGITLPLTDQESLTSLAAELDFNYEPAALTVSRLQLSLDDTSVTGTAAARNLNEQPVYDLALQVNQIDLNRYATRPPATPAAQTPAGPVPAAPAAPQGRGGEEPLLPMALLRGLNFNADLTVNSLKTGKIGLNNLKLKASGKGGAITIAPLTAGLYDGTITVNSEIDARTDIPRIHLTKNTKGIQLGPLFRDLSGKEEITGRADINADLTTRGLTQSELTRNSNGTLNLAVADGEIAKLQIIDTIRTARTLLGAATGRSTAGSGTASTAQAPAGAGQPTTFARLTASGVLTNGVFRNEDLQAQSELMRVNGEGTVDLVSEQIDYLLTIFLAKTIDRNEQTGLVDLAETPIPYRVKGTFDHIEQSAALEEIAKSQAKKVLVKELEKRLGGEKPAGTQQQEKGGTEDLIQKGLKGLFGK